MLLKKKQKTKDTRKDVIAKNLVLNKLKSTHTLSNTEQIVPQQWIHDHVEDDINLMKQDLDRIKQKLHICNTGKQFGNVVLP